jgi:GNAT superfamily N-acetyltransferase
MLPEQIRNFREVVTLRDSAYVLVRPIVKDDKPHLEELFSPLSDEDLRVFRQNVKDVEVVKSWCDNLNYDEVLPVIALVKDRAVGLVTLHFFHGARRHIGEIRIFLAKDFRKRGLGAKMIRVAIDLARKQPQCTLENYFMYPDGECADVVLLVMQLKPKMDEF